MKIGSLLELFKHFFQNKAYFGQDISYSGPYSIQNYMSRQIGRIVSYKSGIDYFKLIKRLGDSVRRFKARASTVEQLKADLETVNGSLRASQLRSSVAAPLSLSF